MSTRKWVGYALNAFSVNKGVGGMLVIVESVSRWISSTAKEVSRSGSALIESYVATELSSTRPSLSSSATELSSTAMKLSLGGDRALSFCFSSNQRVRGSNVQEEGTSNERRAKQSNTGVMARMDSNPYRHGSNFVDLLTSQQSVFSLVEETVPENTHVERKERRMWTPVEDMVLISSWLNTTKDPVVGNEQRSGTFWKRIAAYFAASPKVAATELR
uniref:Myb-like domain-containing protein n=1 Tax=Brassica oleracea var. oleracea TaxID=109376 RepID=A0A0D3DPR7_BRAOL